MTEKYKTTLKDWYKYHDMCAKELHTKAEKHALTLLEKTLLAEHEYWVSELEKEILTAEDVVREE
jgi:hypothetical protein